MRVVAFGWFVGAMAAVGLGMAAEACSSNPSTSGPDGGGPGGSTGATSNGTTATSGAFSIPTGGGGSTAITGATTPTGASGTSAVSGTASGTPSGSLSGSASSGSSASPSSSSTGVSSSTTGTSGSSDTSNSSDTSGGSHTGSSGSGATCYAPPGDKVYSEDGGSFYCPFSKTDAGKAEYCTSGTEHCCEPSSGTATCLPSATTCGATTDTDWECEGTPDCAGHAGTICCGTGALKTQAAQPGCGADGGTVPSYTYVDGFTKATCVAPAACTTFQICAEQSDCSSGTCTPIKPKGNDIGYCAGGIGSGT